MLSEDFLQHWQQVHHLKSQLKAAEQRADAADFRANESDAELASWRQLQADIARSLPTTWESKSLVDGQVDPSIGHHIPRHEMLLHFSKGSTQSPASQMQKDIQISQTSQNPVAVFRQVYQNDDASKQSAAAGQTVGEGDRMKGIGCSETAHLRKGVPLAVS